MKNIGRTIRTVTAVLCAAFLLTGCYEYYPESYYPETSETAPAAGENQEDINASLSDDYPETPSATEELTEGDTYDIHIIDTSDIHGKFYPWDYFLNKEDTSGSLCQLKSAIDDLADEDTIIVDGGDIIQDNCISDFLDYDFAPMAAAMNAIGYDLWCTGNHEYNYGIKPLKKFIDFVDAPLVVGNVYDENGNRIGKPYEIIERGGIKIAFIGETTPNITKWDADNLSDCTVTSPADEANAALGELEGLSDVNIGLFHMGLRNEYKLRDSGCYDLAEDCPGLDLILSSHDHTAISDCMIGKNKDIPVTQNKNKAQTLADIHISMEVSDGKWTIRDITTRTVDVSEYDADEEMLSLLKPYHEYEVAKGEEIIGYVADGEETHKGSTHGVPDILLKDSSVLDFINEVMMYYADSDVSASAPTKTDSTLLKGPLTRNDISNIYKYENTLYKLEMTGAQLKKFMENSVKNYKTLEDGDDYVKVDPDEPYYIYDFFSGVTYEIDLTKPEGSRIKDLKYPDGTPVENEDVLTVAVNNYRVNSCLLVEGLVYEEDDMPKVLEDDIGNIRELICDYITNVNNKKIVPYCDHNWKIVGND